MTDQRDDRVWALLEKCLTADSATRALILKEARCTDAEIAIEVQSLLDGQPPPGFLSPSVAGETAGLLSPGTIIDGKYRVWGQPKRGGMGEVYSAHRFGEITKRVAIKVVRADRQSSAVLAAFKTERQLLADAAVPHVVHIFDAGMHDNLPYMAMEFIEGIPLDQYVTKSDLSRTAALDILTVICRTVGQLHARHNDAIVHGDLKPEHLLITSDGRPVIIDFGAGVRGEYLSGPIAFTPKFTSPEQLLGERPTTRSDVYALGMILIGILDQTRAATWQERLWERDVRLIASRCTQRCPDKRYHTAADVANDLLSALASRSVPGINDTRSRRTVKAAFRHRLALALIGALVITAAFARSAVSKQRRLQSAQLSADALRQLDHNPYAALGLAYRASLLSDDESIIASLRTTLANPVLRNLSVADGTIRHVAFSRDGNVIAATSDTGVVSVFELATPGKHWTIATSLKDAVPRFLSGHELLQIDGSGQTWYLDVENETLFFGASRRLETSRPSTDRVFSASGRLGASWNQQLAAYRLFKWITCCYEDDAVVISNVVDKPRAAAFSPDEALLAVLHHSVLEVFDTKTRAAIGVYQFDGKRALALCFQRAKQIVVGASDGTLVTLELGQVMPRSTMLTHSTEVARVACSPGTATIASLAVDGTLAISNLDTQTTLAKTDTPLRMEAVSMLRLDDDAETVLVGTIDGRVGAWSWEIQPRTDWYFPHTQRVERVGIDKRRRWMAAEDRDGTTRVWDARSRDTLSWVSSTLGGTFQLGLQPIRPVASLPGATGGRPGTSPLQPSVLARDRGRTSLRPVGQKSGAVIFDSEVVSRSDDGTLLAIVSHNRLKIWNVVQRRWTTKYDLPYNLADFIEGTHIVVARDRSSPYATLIDLDTNVETIVKRPTGLWDEATSCDGGEFVALRTDKNITVWRTTTGQVVFAGAVASTRPAIALDCVNHSIAIADEGSSVRVWRIRVGRELLVTAANRDDHSSVAVDASGEFVLTSQEGTMVLWRARDWLQVVRTRPPGPARGLSDNAFDSTGDRVLLVTDEGQLTIWNTRQRKTLGGCCRSDVPVRHALFSPDDKSVAGHLDNGYVIVWDALTGQVRRELDGRRLVRPVVFKPDSQTLVAIDSNGNLLANRLVGNSDAFVKVGEDEQSTEFRFDEIAYAAPNLLAAISHRRGAYFMVVASATGNRTRRVEDEASNFEDLRFSRSGRSVAVQRGLELRVWNVVAGKLKTTIQQGSFVYRHATFTADDRYMLASARDLNSRDRRIIVWDTVTASVMLDVPGTAAGMLPDGSGIVVIDHGSLRWYETPELQTSANALRRAAQELVRAASSGELTPVYK